MREPRRRAERIAVVAVLVGAMVALRPGSAWAFEYCGSTDAPPSEIRKAEQELFRLTNQARRAAGVHPLTWSDAAAAVERKHSQRMAAAGDIFHNDSFFDNRAVVGGGALGENVAVGCIPQSHNSLMRSVKHKANILNPLFTHLGIGMAVSSGGVLYITEGFVHQKGSPVPTASEPSTRPAPKPTPKPASKPAPVATPRTTPKPTPKPTPLPTPKPTPMPSGVEKGVVAAAVVLPTPDPTVPPSAPASANDGPPAVVALALFVLAAGSALGWRRHRGRRAPVAW